MSPRAPVGGVTDAAAVVAVIGCGDDVAVCAAAHAIKKITSDAQKDVDSNWRIICAARGANERSCTRVNLKVVGFAMNVVA